ncbi:hypothetical protein AZE42_09615 [Rhizopogon vesiculosus]|uniref:Uncharacterized protein n=1 Tax=Rhizopogon vesiculosus TaxID=180088 RepID=A0A1J8R4P8_9AGAM|nr:hypothetical protein AZE42_09615 [Rhizopogon vesiculosus]
MRKFMKALPLSHFFFIRYLSSGGADQKSRRLLQEVCALLSSDMAHIIARIARTGRIFDFYFGGACGRFNEDTVGSQSNSENIGIPELVNLQKLDMLKRADGIQLNYEEVYRGSSSVAFPLHVIPLFRRRRRQIAEAVAVSLRSTL